MRFDDGLDTVLAAPMAGAAGLQSTWRQAVDLIGRRRSRTETSLAAIARLRAIRHDVPATVRAASARGLARANPPAALVALFADDETEVAAPVIRTARLSAAEWIALLPEMRPATRGVLRHRRDLSETVERALAAFGPNDFALPAAAAVGAWPPLADEPTAATGEYPAIEAAWPPHNLSDPEPVAAVRAPVWPPAPAARPELAPTPDVAVAVSPPVRPLQPPAPVEPVTAAGWPPAEVAVPIKTPEPPIEAARSVWPPEPVAEPVVESIPEPAVEAAPESGAIELPSATFIAPEPMPFVTLADAARTLPIVAEAMRLEQESVPPPTDNDFEIAEIVARIEAHQRISEQSRTADPTPAFADPAPERFRFETDAHGLVRWCDHPARGPLIGLSLAAGRDGAPAATDGSAGGALARRAAFTDARLRVPGSSAASGTWRISAAPVFDHDTGRFTGFRGTARRPRPDEEPQLARPSPATDALRQLVHELRTPANAISGFAEMIEHEMLGPVPPAYREQATVIRVQTGGLLGAIDDIDTAARIESRSLDQRREPTPLAPLLDRVRTDLRGLADLRGAALTVDVATDAVADGDPLVLQRLFARLLTALIAQTTAGETVSGSVTLDGDGIRCDLSRPAALTLADGALFSADAETESAADGEPLLGSGFAFRLARKLIAETGGSLTIGPESLTVRLPAAVNHNVEQATV